MIRGATHFGPLAHLVPPKNCFDAFAGYLLQKFSRTDISSLVRPLRRLIDTEGTYDPRERLMSTSDVTRQVALGVEEGVEAWKKRVIGSNMVLEMRGKPENGKANWWTSC